MSESEFQGLVPIERVFADYENAWLPEFRSESARTRETLFEKFVRGLLREQVLAFVLPPDALSPRAVPRALFKSAILPDLATHAYLAPDPIPDEFCVYSGRQLYLPEGAVDAGFLNRNGPFIPPRAEDFDGPDDVEVWELPMALAWIATRDVDVVRWQMSPWRLANKAFPASAFIIANARDESAPTDEPLYDLLWPDATGALLQLKNRCVIGDLVATAVSSETKSPDVMPRSAWSHGDLHAAMRDEQMVDQWKVSGGTTYERITFIRRDLLRIWPAAEGSGSGGSVKATEKVPSTRSDKRTVGRPKGSTNWDWTVFHVKYEELLKKNGEPSKQNVQGWRSETEAIETALQTFEKNFSTYIEPPSVNTARPRAKAVTEAWNKAGQPRVTDNSGNSGNSGN